MVVESVVYGLVVEEAIMGEVWYLVSDCVIVVLVMWKFCYVLERL